MLRNVLVGVQMEEKMLIQNEVKKRTEGTRMTESSGPSINTDGTAKIGGVFKVSENPEFIQYRIQVYDRIMAKQRAAIDGI